MSNLKLNLASVPTFAAWSDHIRNNVPASGRIGHNTYARIEHDIDGSRVLIRYHNTDIVVIDNEDFITLNSNGWRTSTTKDRISKILFPFFHLSQVNYEWLITERYGDRTVTPFEDGMVISARETV